MLDKIRVGIADKNPLVRAGLKQLLSEDERFELIVTCTDGEEFIVATTRLPIDVGVIGWVMSPGNGEYVLKKLREFQNAPRIAVYTGAEGIEIPAKVMALGGAGFCTKSEAPHTLLETIATLAEGRMVFPFMDINMIHDDPMSGLTRRERTILAELANGKTNAQIARDQGVSVNTVKFHLKNLYDKLNVRNRAQAVSRYLNPHGS